MTTRPATVNPALSGRTVVVTRPAAQAESLCTRLQALGAHALRFPVLAIGPAPDRAALDRVIERLDDFDLAFFVSPNAVLHAMEAVRARRAWPARVRVATVGKGSEKVLRSHGFSGVIAPQTGFDSEAVLALPEFSAAAISGQRVLILRGDGGRDLLGNSLRARGATVTWASCYRRYCPDADPAPLLNGVDALLLTSSEGVGNLATLLGASGMARMRAVPVFASHPRIAARALDAGFDIVVETPPGDDGLLHALLRHFG